MTAREGRWCADTSVVVAALSSWHDAHEVSREAVEERRPLLPAHVLLEAYSILTRIAGHELAPAIALDILRASFPRRHPVLSAAGHAHLVEQLAAAGIAGGRVYDALVGATAKGAGATLLTRDRRAVPVYELVGSPYELLGA